MDAVSRAPNFDKLARPYRWLEYLTFGRSLERCRFHFLPVLTNARHALVLGDGDGRFLARLLEANPQMRADAVDASFAMLQALHNRLSPESRRQVTLHHIDIRLFTPPATAYDLVVSHFFFDCLLPSELASLVERITPLLAPDALWVVSEFSQPRGRTGRMLGGFVVSGLYQAFGLLTGLQVRTLPDHDRIMKCSGFQLFSRQPWLRGLLISQLWQNSSTRGCNLS